MVATFACRSLRDGTGGGGLESRLPDSSEGVTPEGDDVNTRGTGLDHWGDMPLERVVIVGRDEREPLVGDFRSRLGRAGRAGGGEKVVDTERVVFGRGWSLPKPSEVPSLYIH